MYIYAMAVWSSETTETRIDPSCVGTLCLVTLPTYLSFSGKPFKKPSSLVSQQHKKKRKRREEKKESALMPINQFISQACKLNLIL